ncbi:sugar ABC transporter permease [Mycetocola miduiensis]|uniref:Xylose transport system permease protein XylH n=1 Tax=Mycetocola miduiensis TaxID=995034 RepID=A0A1I5AFG0_9MICO|nr:hypothetical protein [Mycetocola miduiensis]SFN61204.1 D-xylose transport system permease protein [Mycetocola miduiensis]
MTTTALDSRLAPSAAKPVEGFSNQAYSMRRENGGYNPVPGLVALAIIYVFFAAVAPVMLGSFTLQSIVLSMVSYGFVALGVVLVLTLGEIDLSVGSVAGLASAVTGTLLQVMHFPWWVSIIAGIAAGMAAGVIQGLLVTKLAVPSFVITLGGLLSWQGLQLMILNDTTLNVVSDELDVIGSGVVTQPVSWFLALVVVVVCGLERFVPLIRKGASSDAWLRRGAAVAGIAIAAFGCVALFSRGSGVPMVLWIFAGLVGLMGFILQKTRVGRAVYAVGGNREAARRAGYRPDLVRVVVFGLSGGFAALGGVYITARGGTADTLTGSGSLVLIAIAAAVIGGCSLFGGRSSPWAAFIGAAVLATLVQGLNITNQGADLQLILQGAILVAAVAVDAILRRRIANRTSAPSRSWLSRRFGRGDRPAPTQQ